MLGTTKHFPLYIVSVHQFLNLFHNAIDEFLAFGQALSNVIKEIFVRLGIEVFQAQVL